MRDSRLLFAEMILRLQKLKKIRIGGLYKEQMQKNENHVALKPGTTFFPALFLRSSSFFVLRSSSMAH
jgi:hypothetical protein